MGCDIHVYIEYKKKKTNNWKSFGGQVYADRNYSMFGILSGVRGNSDSLFKVKGIPKDLARMANGDYYQSDDSFPSAVPEPDWHTPSWLTCDEFEKVVNGMKSKGGNETYEAILAAMKILESYHNDVRVVFWFEN